MVGYPKTTGNRGLHVYVRLEPRWDSFEVRAGAVALARELERRYPDLITANWWKEERGKRIFIDFNQNAPHKTVFGAWFARPRVGGQVSTPSDLGRDRLGRAGRADDPHRPRAPAAARRPVGEIAERPQSLQPLLDLAERDRAAGLHDAPWPPEYPKQPDEPTRVSPSRAKKRSTRWTRPPRCDGSPISSSATGRRRYKVRAFRNAAAAIADRPVDELSAMTHTRLQKIPDVGETSARVIAEAAAGGVPDYLAKLEVDEAPEMSDAAGDLRARLQGDCHSHSDWSDGGSPIREMAEAARELGHDYWALTDHSPGSPSPTD